MLALSAGANDLWVRNSTRTFGGLQSAVSDATAKETYFCPSIATL